MSSKPVVTTGLASKSAELAGDAGRQSAPRAAVPPSIKPAKAVEYVDYDDPDENVGTPHGDDVGSMKLVSHLCGRTTGGRAVTALARDLLLSALLATFLAILSAVVDSSCKVWTEGAGGAYSPRCMLLSSPAGSWLRLLAFALVTSVPARIADKLVFAALTLATARSDSDTWNTAMFFLTAFEGSISRFGSLGLVWTYGSAVFGDVSDSNMWEQVLQVVTVAVTLGVLRNLLVRTVLRNVLVSSFEGKIQETLFANAVVLAVSAPHRIDPDTGKAVHLKDGEFARVIRMHASTNLRLKLDFIAKLRFRMYGRDGSLVSVSRRDAIYSLAKAAFRRVSALPPTSWVEVDIRGREEEIALLPNAVQGMAARRDDGHAGLQAGLPSVASQFNILPRTSSAYNVTTPTPGPDDEGIGGGTTGMGVAFSTSRQEAGGSANNEDNIGRMLTTVRGRARAGTSMAADALRAGAEALFGTGGGGGTGTGNTGTGMNRMPVGRSPSLNTGLRIGEAALPTSTPPATHPATATATSGSTLLGAARSPALSSMPMPMPMPMPALTLGQTQTGSAAPTSRKLTASTFMPPDAHHLSISPRAPASAASAPGMQGMDPFAAKGSVHAGAVRLEGPDLEAEIDGRASMRLSSSRSGKGSLPSTGGVLSYTPWPEEGGPSVAPTSPVGAGQGVKRRNSLPAGELSTATAGASSIHSGAPGQPSHTVRWLEEHLGHLGHFGGHAPRLHASIGATMGRRMGAALREVLREGLEHYENDELADSGGGGEGAAGGNNGGGGAGHVGGAQQGKRGGGKPDGQEGDSTVPGNGAGNGGVTPIPGAPSRPQTVRIGAIAACLDPSELDLDKAVVLFSETGAGEVTREQFIAACENAWGELRALKASLNGQQSVVTALSNLIDAGVAFLLAFSALIVFQVDILDVMVPLGTILVSASFAIGTAISNMVNSLIFVLRSPYHVGDRVTASGVLGGEETLIVRKIDLLTSTFLRPTNREITVPNFKLLDMNIENLKRSPPAVLKLILAVSAGTTASQLEGLRRRINGYLDAAPASWKPGCTIRAIGVRDQAMDLMLFCQSRHAWQDVPRLFKAHFALWMHVLEGMRVEGIAFRGADQTVRLDGNLHVAPAAQPVPFPIHVQLSQPVQTAPATTVLPTI